MEEVPYCHVRLPFRQTDHVDHTVITPTPDGRMVTVSSYMDIVLKPLSQHVNLSKEAWSGEQALAAFALTMDQDFVTMATRRSLSSLETTRTGESPNVMDVVVGIAERHVVSHHAERYFAQPPHSLLLTQAGWRDVRQRISELEGTTPDLENKSRVFSFARYVRDTYCVDKVTCQLSPAP